ncbi:MAG: hypothetical protein IPN20_03075 [Haliscomenobacter sp.]|nr:hypothetical protein [Haliscomenobacter sp.]
MNFTLLGRFTNCLEAQTRAGDGSVCGPWFCFLLLALLSYLPVTRMAATDQFRFGSYQFLFRNPDSIALASLDNRHYLGA